MNDQSPYRGEGPRFSQQPRHQRHPLICHPRNSLWCGYRSYCCRVQWTIESTRIHTYKDTVCLNTSLRRCHRFRKQTHTLATVILEDLTPQTDTQTLAIDGKTLCGSRKQDATITHLLSVVSHQLGITLTQQPVELAIEILQAMSPGRSSQPTPC